MGALAGAEASAALRPAGHAGPHGIGSRFAPLWRANRVEACANFAFCARHAGARHTTPLRCRARQPLEQRVFRRAAVMRYPRVPGPARDTATTLRSPPSCPRRIADIVAEISRSGPWLTPGKPPVGGSIA